MADEALAELARRMDAVPYLRWIGVRFTLERDTLVTQLPYARRLIGNPVLPAMHGGVISALLETAALATLIWTGRGEGDRMAHAMPCSIGLTVDYLRPGRPMDSRASASVTRAGRRYASVHAQAWQDDPAKPFAQATGHFLMPKPVGRTDQWAAAGRQGDCG